MQQYIEFAKQFLALDRAKRAKVVRDGSVPHDVVRAAFDVFVEANAKSAPQPPERNNKTNAEIWLDRSLAVLVVLMSLFTLGILAVNAVRMQEAFYDHILVSIPEATRVWASWAAALSFDMALFVFPALFRFGLLGARGVEEDKVSNWDYMAIAVFVIVVFLVILTSGAYSLRHVFPGYENTLGIIAGAVVVLGAPLADLSGGHITATIIVLLVTADQRAVHQYKLAMQRYEKELRAWHDEMWRVFTGDAKLQANYIAQVLTKLVIEERNSNDEREGDDKAARTRRNAPSVSAQERAYQLLTAGNDVKSIREIMRREGYSGPAIRTAISRMRKSRDAIVERWRSEHGMFEREAREKLASLLEV